MPVNLFAAPAALALALVAAPALAAAPTVAGCPLQPPDNVWNARIDALPVDPHSDAYVASIGADTPLKGDFGAAEYEGGPIGIPFAIVPFKQAKVPITITDYVGYSDAAPDESDTGDFPIPPDAPIEGGPDGTGDRHVIIVQEGSCTLFELFGASPNADGGWNAASAARFDLEGNELRYETWTSADAAGLPIFPGLVRYEEVAAGAIDHALRFTAPKTQRAYVWPARHFASDDEDEALPPMGQRFRLKADVDISGFSPEMQVILTALKTYGMLLADNGSPWFLSGAPNPKWNDEMIHDELGKLKGSDFEAVDTTSLMVDPDSAQAKQD